MGGYFETKVVSNDRIGQLSGNDKKKRGDIWRTSKNNWIVVKILENQLYEGLYTKLSSLDLFWWYCCILNIFLELWNFFLLERMKLSTVDQYF
jgi:hypothetical protein